MSIIVHQGKQYDIPDDLEKRIAINFSFWCRHYRNCGDSGWGCLSKYGESGFMHMDQAWELYKKETSEHNNVQGENNKL